MASAQPQPGPLATGAADSYQPSAAASSSSGTEPAATPVPTDSNAEAAATPARHSHRLLKTVAAGLVVASALGGLAVHTIDQAPICPNPNASAVSVVDGQVCISPLFGSQSQVALRVARGSTHVGQFLQDLASSHNEVFHPQGETTPPRPLMEDGHLRVVTWNLHKEDSPEGTGARHQDAQIEQALRNAKGDAYLLQEVAPWQVQSLANALGMNGYYTMVTPEQGNLVLINPSLTVKDDFHALVNRDITPGDQGAALRIMGEVVQRSRPEPRAVVGVEVALPSGQSLALWDTHLSLDASAGQASNQAQRVDEVRHIAQALTQNVAAGTQIVGGGDFNASSTHAVLAGFRDQGFHATGAGIDWLTSLGSTPAPTVQGQVLRDAHGVQLSDHPMVIGTYSVQ